MFYNIKDDSCITLCLALCLMAITTEPLEVGMLTHSLTYLRSPVCICFVQTTLFVRNFFFRMHFKYVHSTCHCMVHMYATLAVPWRHVDYLLFISLPWNFVYSKNIFCFATSRGAQSESIKFGMESDHKLTYKVNSEIFFIIQPWYIWWHCKL